MTAYIAHVPTLQDDETLSSLLLRLAYNHSATSHELCVHLWPTDQFWTRDIDRTIADMVLSRIARATSIPYSQLEQATLRGLIEKMGLAPYPNGIQRGILPIGVYHRIRRRFGQQYCARCLSDKPAYLRRLWRMDLLVACPQHGILLSDCCPACAAPFMPHRNDALVRTSCHHCGTSLLTGAELAPPASAFFVQGAALQLLGLNANEYVPDLPPYLTRGAALCGVPSGREFVDGIRRLCRLAACHSEVVQGTSSQDRKDWSLFRLHERADVLATVGQWLLDWPNRWVRWAHMAYLSQHYLNDAFGPWPAWTMCAISQLPYSHGPTGIQRRRHRQDFAHMRGCYPNMAAYREARAKFILKKVAALRGRQ